MLQNKYLPQTSLLLIRGAKKLPIERDVYNIIKYRQCFEQFHSISIVIAAVKDTRLQPIVVLSV